MLSVSVDFIILMSLSGEQNYIIRFAVLYNITYRVLAPLDNLVFGAAINSAHNVADYRARIFTAAVVRCYHREVGERSRDFAHDRTL